MDFLAVVLGGVLGVISSILGGRLIAMKEREEERRSFIVQKYLFQLQDSVEQLHSRVFNINMLGGRKVMSDEYYHNSSLYILASVIAAENVIFQNGSVPQIKLLFSEVGDILDSRPVSKWLTGVRFHKWERQYLAEMMMERREDGAFQLVGYSDFFSAVEMDRRGVVSNIKENMDNIFYKLSEEFKDDLVRYCAVLSKHTGVKSTVRRYAVQ